MKKRKTGKNSLKINYQIFRSFLFSLSLVLELISFACSGVSAIVVSALSFASALGVIATTSVKKFKKKDYFNLDHSTVLATLLMFCMGAFYQALISLQLYITIKLVFDANKFFVPKTSTVSKKIKDRKYHIIYSGEAETVCVDEIENGAMLELY